MQSLPEKNAKSKKHNNNLKVPIQNSVTFGDKKVFRDSHLEHNTSKRQTSCGIFKTQIITGLDLNITSALESI